MPVIIMFISLVFSSLNRKFTLSHESKINVLDGGSKKVLLNGISRITFLDQIFSQDNQTFELEKLYTQAEFICKDIEKALEIYLFQKWKENPEFLELYNAIKTILHHSQILSESLKVSNLNRNPNEAAIGDVLEDYIKIALQPILIFEKYVDCFGRNKEKRPIDNSETCNEEEQKSFSVDCKELFRKSTVERMLDRLMKKENKALTTKVIIEVWSNSQTPRGSFLKFFRMAILQSFLSILGETVCKKYSVLSDYAIRSYDLIPLLFKELKALDYEQYLQPIKLKITIQQIFNNTLNENGIVLYEQVYLEFHRAISKLSLDYFFKWEFILLIGNETDSLYLSRPFLCANEKCLWIDWKRRYQTIDPPIQLETKGFLVVWNENPYCNNKEHSFPANLSEDPVSFTNDFTRENRNLEVLEKLAGQFHKDQIHYQALFVAPITSVLRFSNVIPSGERLGHKIFHFKPYGNNVDKETTVAYYAIGLHRSDEE